MQLNVHKKTGETLKIHANDTEISILNSDEGFENSYLSLTDLAQYKNSDDPRIVISNWLSSYSTIDFLATWESLYNPNFNRMEIQTVRIEKSAMRIRYYVIRIDIIRALCYYIFVRRYGRCL